MNETTAAENNIPDIPKETRERVIAEHYKALSAKGNAARRGTEKARRHAALIGLKGSMIAKRRAAARRAAKEAEALKPEREAGKTENNGQEM